MNFAEKITASEPQAGEIGLFWLGQAGFLIKNSRGKLMAVDPYLSDLSERLDGNKRLMMPVMEAKDLKADILLVTHYHTDHLDLDSLPALLEGNTVLYGSEQTIEKCKSIRIPDRKLIRTEVGEIQTRDGFTVETVFADHGDAATGAVGFIVGCEGIKIYFTGDTSYQTDRMKHAAEQEIDILVLPINGEYGNMNERDAAMLAGQVKPRLTIPSHFWTFSRHRGNPYDFENEMKANAPDCPYYIMAQGEFFYYSAAGGIRKS